VVVAASAWLPWHRSGQVRRSCFALARIADSLGVVTGAPRRVLFVAVFLLPLLAASTFLAAAIGSRRSTGLLACATGIVGPASAAVVLRLSGGQQVGPVVALAAAVAAVGCGAHLVLRRSIDG
jgi:hypothetical protein